MSAWRAVGCTKSCAGGDTVAAQEPSVSEELKMNLVRKDLDSERHGREKI